MYTSAAPQIPPLGSMQSNLGGSAPKVKPSVSSISLGNFPMPRAQGSPDSPINVRNASLEHGKAGHTPLTPRKVRSGESRSNSEASIASNLSEHPYGVANGSSASLAAAGPYQHQQSNGIPGSEKTWHSGPYSSKSTVELASNSTQNMNNTPRSVRGEDMGMPRSVTHVWSGLKKHGVIPRSASATAFNNRKPVLTKGGRAIPTRGDLGAFAHPSAQIPGSPGGANGSATQAIPAGLGIGSSSSSFSTVPTSSGYSQDYSNTSINTDDDWHRRAPSRKASTATISSLGGRSAILAASSRKEPLVYPAMLSRVAQKFRERMNAVLGDRVKNELTYKNAFAGNEAVDVIAYIIKTPDRNLALLVGRSLDAQKLFHDVTYDNRLRDSKNEIYQFTTYDEQSETQVEPNGVFTLLSECYSPTCSRNRLCYSISCPRRLEQQARLNMKLDPGLLLSNQAEASITLNDNEQPKEKLWRYNVPPEVVEATPPKEQKRQEAIAELIYTEREFVKSLEYLRESWIKPLHRSTILGPEHRRDKFIRMVFLNVLEVHATNLKFAEALTRRQQIAPVVHQIADVVLEYVPRFDPFVTYGAQQMYAKYEFEKERALNPAFAKFVQQTERDPESQQLELNGYLTKPTTRLARYPLLLEAILKRTEEGNPDTKNIPEAISEIRKFLFRVNAETGKAENRFSLHQLNQALTFRAGEYVDLHLLDPKRQLIFKGNLSKNPSPSEANIQIYLFDNAILFAKKKKVSGMSSTAAAAAAAAAAAVEPPSGDEPSTGREVLRVNSKPIPLQLLHIAGSDEIGKRRGHMIRTTITRNTDDKATFPLTFQHLGRRGYEVTLYAENFQARKTWVETLLKQQEAQRVAANIFSQHTLYTSNSISGKAQCSAVFDGGKRALFGTDKGVYLSTITYQTADGEFNPVSTSLKLILPTTSGPVTQIDVVEKYGLVLILSDRTLSSLPIDLLEPGSDNTRTRGLKILASQVTFYKINEYLGRTLLVVVKSNNLSSTIRVLEPVSSGSNNQKRPPLKRFLTSGGSAAQSEGFKMAKPPIDIPSATLSLSFLRTHLCLGCSRGFELLDLDKGKFESLLDPADTSLDFVIKRESLRPISLYRIGKEFLLNYSDFSFFINRNGWRSRPDWIIQWECTPQHIVLSYPYLVAFDHNMIEIRNMDTELLRVIQGESIRFLHESAHDILYAVENERGQDEVVSINFWEKQHVPKRSVTA